jgi:hypothetical protein
MRGHMHAKNAFARLGCADLDLIDAAGPAVLRLKLLEVTHLAQSRRLPEDVKEVARLAADELRRLIDERPCVSLVDYAAKTQLAAICALNESPSGAGVAQAPLPVKRLLHDLV